MIDRAAIIEFERLLKDYGNGCIRTTSMHAHIEREDFKAREQAVIGAYVEALAEQEKLLETLRPFAEKYDASVSTGIAKRSWISVHLSDLKRAKDALAAVPPAPPSMSWRCFHCDEVFTTRESAREHFGADEVAQTACQIDIAEYRRLEDQQAACRAECCEEAKRYHAAEADNRRALVAEEERGYDRGVADARKEADRSSGISWSGFNVHGDRKSIDAVTAALHSQDIEPQLRAEIVASRARSIPEREKVLEALKVGRYCANELMELGEAYLIERTKIEAAIAELERK